MIKIELKEIKHKTITVSGDFDADLTVNVAIYYVYLFRCRIGIFEKILKN